jgi:hypothetical protein
MKFIYFSAFLLIFLKLNANAQNNFTPGYIVTLNGDTTKGFIDQKQLTYDPDQIIFKANANAVAVNHSKQTINAFGVEGYGNYHTYIVKVKQNTAPIGVMLDYVDTLVVTKNVFLREIVSGKKVSLFVYDDNIKPQFFVAESNSLPYELTGYEYNTFAASLQTATSMKIVKVDAYKKQLQQLAALYQPGNTILAKKIEYAHYELKDLKETIIAINGDDVKYIEARRRSDRFFIGLGVNVVGARFTGEMNVYYSLGNVWSYLPQLNAGFDTFMGKNSKFIFRGEINLSASKSEFSYSNQVFTGPFGAYSYTYNNNLTRVAISLNPQILYNFYNANHIKAFIGGGIKMDFSLYPENKGTYTISTNIANFDPSFNISPVGSHINANTKAGITLKRFQVYGSYNLPITLATFNIKTDNHLVLTSYNFGVNYFLSK